MADRPAVHRGQRPDLANVANRLRPCPGNHTVQARATNHDGVVQTEATAEPIPNGASGWPATTFTAA